MRCKILITSIIMFIFAFGNINDKTIVKAYTKFQIQAMKDNGIDVSSLVAEGANDITPQNLEKQLKTQILKNNENKEMFINTLDQKDNYKSFFNNLDFLKNVKNQISELNSSKYNLDKNELEMVSKQFEQCTYRDSTSCIKKATTNAQNITQHKQNINWYVSLASQVLIGINIIFWVFYLFSSKKEVEVIISEN